MSINKIKTLTMNPHFFSLLMQSFLSGYGKPCEIKLACMAIPILLYVESREKLVNANRRSRIDTLFQSPQIIEDNMAFDFLNVLNDKVDTPIAIRTPMVGQQ